MPEYVIIGGSVGAVGAIEAIREVDPVGTIAVISAESTMTYSRPMIGEYLSGEVSLDSIMYRTDEFWRSNMVEVFLGRRAMGIALDEKYVKLDSDQKISFEKLLIATGSKPVIPKIEGINKKGVYTFTTLADVECVKARVKGAGKAVIVGGGLIGVCAAEALAKLGIETTIVELKETILGLLLDASASTIVQAAIQKKDVNVITGHALQRVLGKKEVEEEVGEVVLDNGKVIPCEIVVMAIGVRPCTDLTLGTEIKTNMGIIVDRFMRTSVPYVYACGDVAEAYDFISRENRVLPQWPTAYMGGRVAGLNMAGENVQYTGGTVMSALKYFDVPIIVAGTINPKDNAGYEKLVSYQTSSDSYQKVVIRNGKIEGFILVRDIERAGILFYLMNKSVNIEDFKGKLLSESFGFACLPENLRKIIQSESVM